MKKIITLLAVIVCLNISNLNAKGDSTAVLKNSIGISLTPMLTIQAQAFPDPYASKGTFGGMAGIGGNLVIGKKRNTYLSAELGYFCNSASEKNVPTEMTTTPGNNTSVPASNATYFNIYYRYSYIYFAASIQKVLVKISNKVFLFGGLGAQLNYDYSAFDKTTNLVDINGNNIDRKFRERTSSFSVSPFVKVGIMANITQRISLVAAPVFYYNIPISIGNLGLNLQANYAF